MLTLNAAGKPGPDDRSPRIGLAIAGGGPLGAIYELGALQALDEGIDGLRLHALDSYVGVSAGAFLAASLANEVSTSRMCRIFVGAPDAEFVFEPETFLRPAFGEFARRAGGVPAAVVKMLAEAVRHPSRITHLESFGGLSRVLPTGLFDNRTIEEFVARVLDRPGRSNDFRELQTRLRIVAVDLDSGEAVRFGEPENAHVPISKAVQASAALPGLYPPVEIEGRYYVDGALRRTLHASVALKQGVDLLIGLNPLVPFRAGARKDSELNESRMVEGGLPLVLSQTFRAMIQSRMQIGIEKYGAQFPTASMMLVEPDRDDELMFFTNIFSYSSRSHLADHAYQFTRAELLARAGELEPFLEPYGMGLNRAALTRTRSLFDSLGEEPVYRTELGESLASSLERLERYLERSESESG